MLLKKEVQKTLPEEKNIINFITLPFISVRKNKHVSFSAVVA